MRRIVFAFFGMLSLFLVITSTAAAQGEIPTRITLQNRAGELPFSTSIGTSVEHVDASTGTLNVRIPIVSVPGRGMGAGLYLQFNSNYFLMAPRTDSSGAPYWVWTIPINGGWHTNRPYTSYAGGNIKCDALPGGGSGGYDSYSASYIYYDEDGAPHPLAVQLHTNTGSCSGITDSPNPDLAGGGAIGTPTTVTSPDGTVVSSHQSWVDANGNQKAWGVTGGWAFNEVNTTVDTLGRTFFTSQNTSDAQGNPLQTTYTVHDSSGASQNYIVNWQKVNIATAFANSTLSYGPEHELTTYWYALSSIQLPNNTSYSFKYDNGGYGGITEIDLPDGGVVTYTYANLENAFKTKRYVTSRTLTVNGVSSTWTFSIVPTFGIDQNADVYTSTVTYPAVGTPPVSSQSVFSNSEGGVTDAQIYPGTAQGTPLREYKIAYKTDSDPYADDACYDPNSNLPPLAPQAVGMRVTSVTTILENGQQSQKQYDYEPNVSYVYHPNHCTFVSPGNDSKVAKTYTTSRGNVTEIREYDWGSGAPGALIRRTDNVYGNNTNSNYLSRNIVNKITQQTIYDGSGNQIAQAQYEYDNYVSGSNGLISTASTAAQHDDTNFPATFIYRGNVTRVKRWRNTDSALLTTVYSYDDLGNIRAIADPLAHSTNYSYADSFANTSCPPTAGKTGQAYVTQVTNALSQNVQLKYFPCSALTQARKDQNDINAGRAGTTHTYDLFGRSLVTQFPDGGQTANSYIDSTASSVTATTLITNTPSTLNRVSATLLDGIGRPIQTQLTSDPEGTDFVDTTYDALGRINTVSNPHRASGLWTDGTTTTQYDALGRVTTLIPPDGTSTSNNVTTSYSGNCTTVTDQAGKARKSCSDALGRLTQVYEDPANLNYLTAYSYDVLGNLKNVVQAGSRTRTFSYDSLSQLLTATNPESGVITYTYDNDSNVSTKTDARNVTTTYTYDSLNRLTNKSYSDGTPVERFYFDAGFVPGGATPQNTIGRLVTAQTPITDSAFSYDAMGRPVWNVQATPQNCCSTGWTLNYSYDFMGNMTSSSTGFGTTFSYTYDGAARPKTFTSNLVDAQHPAAIFTPDSLVGYFPNGALRKGAFGNGLTQTNMYNNRLQPCLMETNSSNATLQTCNDSPPTGDIVDFLTGFYLQVGNTFVNNGNVWRWYGSGTQPFLRSYSYDSLNRLSTMSDTGTSELCKGLSWTYDSWGNRTDQTVTSGTCNTFHNSVDANNRLVGTPYQYDAAGNMIHDGAHSYTYDAENRITAVDGGSTASYYYDAQGYRVHRLVGTSTMEYLYDLHGNPVAEILPSGSLNAFYMYFGGKQVAEYYNLTTYFIHQDHLGSTRLLTAMDKSIFDSMDYSPFGEQIAGASVTTHKFTGKERDSETASHVGGNDGLDNFGARYYASSLGRFITPDWSASQDPVPYAELDNPQSLNLYAYVQNNPLTFHDATGHYHCDPDTATWGPDGVTVHAGACHFDWSDLPQIAAVVGHHFIPRAVWQNISKGSNAWRVLEKTTSGALKNPKISNPYDRLHRALNKQTDRLLRELERDLGKSVEDFERGDFEQLGQRLGAAGEDVQAFNERLAALEPEAKAFAEALGEALEEVFPAAADAAAATGEAIGAAGAAAAEIP